LVLTSTFPRWQDDKEPPFVFELSRRLAKNIDIIVLAPHARGARTLEEIDGIKVVRFRYCFEKWERLAYEGGIVANLKMAKWRYLLVPLFMLGQLLAVMRILRDDRIDVIHAHWIFPQGFTALIARMVFRGYKPSIVCTSHGGDLFGLPGKLFLRLKRLVLERANKITVVSEAMRNYAYMLAQRRDIEVISMGVDTAETFTPGIAAERAQHELLFVGRLVEKKGLRHLILAMPEILKKFNDCILLVAGTGPEESALRELARSMGVAAHIRFMGAVDNHLLPELYRHAALFVAPSVVAKGGDQEGLGLVLVEALACECAVLASDLPAIRDVVIDGVTGSIARPGDSGDIARKVIELLEDPAKGRKMAEAGRHYVADRFDWKLVAGRYEALLLSI
jgi:glycosyltransferase involved in cell wall biosynthesis